jgi:hypothetical protein
MQRLQVEFVDVSELVERWQVCGNRMQLAVVAAGVLVEVDTWIRGGIHRALVEARQRADWSGRLRMERQRGDDKRRAG